MCAAYILYIHLYVWPCLWHDMRDLAVLQATQQDFAQIFAEFVFILLSLHRLQARRVITCCLRYGCCDAVDAAVCAAAALRRLRARLWLPGAPDLNPNT